MDDQMAEAWATINAARARVYDELRLARRTIDATEITHTSHDGRVAVSVHGNLRPGSVEFARDTFRHYTEEQLGAEVLRLHRAALFDANAAQLHIVGRIFG